MADALPHFPYHPDPIATGFVEESAATCRACGMARGLIYTGPVSARQELIDAFCPWCIANGTAAAAFAAEFTDVGVDVPDDVPGTVTEAIATRTPGFGGWQQEHWLYHCGDGAAFLGVVGRPELDAYPEALAMLRDEGPEEMVEDLDRDGEASAYLFRCRACGTYLAYMDCA